MCFKRHRIPKHLLLKPSPPPSRAIHRVLRWIFSSVVILSVLAVVTQARAEEGPEPNAATAGILLFKQQNGFNAALHLHSDAEVTIQGMLASVVLRQTFENLSDEWVEGVYVFPLPEEAAVNRMVMEIGERRIVATIKEKQEAKRIYEQAKSDGKHAALTSQQRPNLFTQSIANIGPHQIVTIELHYNDVISYCNETFSWRLPTTLTPRYIPGITRDSRNANETLELEQRSGWGWALPTDQVPDADRITPFMVRQTGADENIINPIAINISLAAGMPLAWVRGSYHDLSVHKTGDVHQITTAQGSIPMDRDFEMTWQTVAGKAPDAAFFNEQVDGDDYALLMLMPPQDNWQGQALPREIIFIIGTSGSMGGTSIRQAKDSLQLALGRLSDQDRFNVIEFNSYHQALFPQPRDATAKNIQHAQNFVSHLHADGGTEMAPALQEALRGSTPEGFLKQIVFITDGSVGNEVALFELIHRELGTARLFTVGIGSAPNSYFMTKAAEFGRGTFTFIGDQSEVAAKMQQLFTMLESPVLSDIEIHWPANLSLEAWPARIPDLYQGEPLLVSIKVNGGLPEHSEIEIHGQQAGQAWSRKLKITPLENNAEADQTSAIAVRWARKKIAALLDERARGRSEEEVRQAVLPIALQHQLLSPYTSFVAVEDTPKRPQGTPLLAAPVSNLMPAGSSMATPLSYPRTATSMGLNVWLGVFALLVLLLLRRFRGASTDKR